ncbi:DUF2325 domain-containing protein [Huintestinicola sp.]|mgnify:FL=1
MSVVVVGGNDRMATMYKDICKSYKCKAKVFTQMPSNLEKQIGSPDLVVVFTNTCSHKMTKCVDNKADKLSFKVEKIHNASANALKTVLEQYCRA